MGAFDTLLRSMGQPLAESFAGGIDEDRLRRRNIADQVTAYRSLMPYKLETAEKEAGIKQRLQSQAAEADLRKVLTVEALKRSMDPRAQATASLSAMFQNPQTVNVPWNVEMGSEGEVPVGGTPTALPIDRRRATGLAVQSGIRGKDLESLLASAEGAQGPATPKAAEIYMDRDPISGAIQRINKVTGEVLDVPRAANVSKPALPWNENTIAAMLSGAQPLPEGVTPPQVERARDELIKLRGASTGARMAGSLDAQIEREKQIASLAAAKSRATRQVGLEYLPMEVRIRAQEALNVATDPKNVQAVAEKINTEETARQGARPLPEGHAQPIALLRTTASALQELKGEFSPQEREQYVGIINNPVLRTSQFWAGNPRFAKFQALMGRIKKSAFDDGGKQLTPFEFSVVAQYVPQGNEVSWADFEAKLAVAEDYTSMLMRSRLELATKAKGEWAKTGIQPLPLSGKEPGQPTGLSGQRAPSGVADGEYTVKGQRVRVKNGVIQ